MINWLSFFVGLRYSFSRKQSHLVAFISRVSTAGMVLAVSLLILVTSVLNGFDKALREQIIGIVPHVTLMSKQPISDWQPLIEQAVEHPGVEAAVPFSFTQGMLIHDEKVKSVIVFGIDMQYEPADSVMRQILEGEGFGGFTQLNQVLVAKPLADKLSVNAGDQLQLITTEEETPQKPKYHSVEVKQLFLTGTQLDQRLVVTDTKTLAQLQGFDTLTAVNGIRLYLTDIFSSYQVAHELRESLGLYSISDWTQSQGNLYQAVQMSRKLVLFLVFIIVAVAAFNLVSTLVLAVNDKSSDIAILRTLGCNRLQILGIFFLQGAAIALVGITVGVILGVIFSLTITEAVQFVESVMQHHFLKTEVYPVDHLPTDIRMMDIVIISGLAFSLSLVASVLPALRAASLQPAKILRYE